MFGIFFKCDIRENPQETIQQDYPDSELSGIVILGELLTATFLNMSLIPIQFERLGHRKEISIGNIYKITGACSMDYTGQNNM